MMNFWHKISYVPRTVDGIILIQNDDILDKLHKKSPDCQVSFEAVNKVIAHTIAGLVLPTDSLTTSRYSTWCMCAHLFIEASANSVCYKKATL